VANLIIRGSRLPFPQVSLPGNTLNSRRATCAFNTYPQITRMLTTTNFITTRGGK
jgi:hypothetical protein